MLDLDLTTLDDFRATWNDGPLSSSKKLERLRSIFKFALVRKWISENPATNLKSPKVNEKPTLPFPDSEMTQILKTAALPEIDVRVRTFILTMRYGGLRISDTTALACESLKGDRLQLHQAKTGEYVSVPLPTFVADALRKVVHRNPAYFFWTGTSKLPAAVSVWRKRLADVFKKAKIKNGHSHRFRDTFAVFPASGRSFPRGCIDVARAPEPADYAKTLFAMGQNPSGCLRQGRRCSYRTQRKRGIPVKTVVQFWYDFKGISEIFSFIGF